MWQGGLKKVLCFINMTNYKYFETLRKNDTIKLRKVNKASNLPETHLSLKTKSLGKERFRNEQLFCEYIKRLFIYIQ